MRQGAEEALLAFIAGMHSEQSGATLRPIGERARDIAGEKGGLPNALR
jgi:hypothetical protein